MGKKPVLGWILVVAGIAAAFMGTYFYQYAITGVMTQIDMGNWVEARNQYMANMILTGFMSTGGIIMIVIGMGLTISARIG
ncbi:MAG: hypothetical protein ACFFCS_14145 [Candidatus Hodarchaeota archaeon]